MNASRRDASSLCVHSQVEAIGSVGGGGGGVGEGGGGGGGGVADGRVNTHCWCYLLVHLCYSGPQLRLPGPAGCPERSESSWHRRWSWLWCLLPGRGGGGGRRRRRRRRRREERRGRWGRRVGDKDTDSLDKRRTKTQGFLVWRLFLLNTHLQKAASLCSAFMEFVQKVPRVRFNIIWKYFYKNNYICCREHWLPLTSKKNPSNFAALKHTCEGLYCSLSRGYELWRRFLFIV